MVSEEELPLHQEEIIMGALSPELVDLWLAKAFNGAMPFVGEGSAVLVGSSK
jgi:hypothetical protein